MNERAGAGWQVNGFSWLVLGVLLVAGGCLVESADAQDGVSSTASAGTQAEAVDALRALRLTSIAMREAVAKVAPTLVTIESYGGSGAIAGRIGGIRKQGEGNTTGVVIDPEGYIITSTFNFIQRPPVITVITHDGQRHVAQMLGKDNTRKLCLLKIEVDAALPCAAAVDPGQVRLGQWVTSVGVGFGDSNPATSVGIISAKNRVGGKAIQTDANISPACYGGPLIDLEGGVVGICVPLNPQSQAIGAGVEWYDSGIGFAIPLYGLEEVLERLKRGETIDPAFLGIQPLATADNRGIEVQAAIPGSPAEVAGLKSGDTLLAINGEPVTDVLKLRQVLGRFEAGTRVTIRYQDVETGEEREAELTLESPPRDDEAPQLEPPRIR